MGQVNVDKLTRDFHDAVLPVFVVPLSEPLLDRRYFGAQWTLTSSLSNSTTRFERMRPGDIDHKALACRFVDDRQAFQLLTVGAGAEHTVLGPDSIATAGRQWPRPSVCNTPPRPLFRQLEASVASNPVIPTGAHDPALSLQDHLDDPSVTVPRVLSCELVHRLNHRCILEGCRFSQVGVGVA
jgi:hypothetical protein